MNSIGSAEIEMGKFLGRGASANVFKGTYRGQEVAIKIFNQFIDENETILDEMKNEQEIMKSLRHPRVIRFIKSSIEDGQFRIIMEYMPGGSLLTFIEKKKKASEVIRHRISLDVAEAMEYLHRLSLKSVVHCDLKCDNILLDGNGRAKIGDLGSAHTKSLNSTYGRNESGTYKYMAPEKIATFPEGKNTPAMDVYAYGVVLWEIFHWTKSMHKVPVFELTNKVLSNEIREPIDQKLFPPVKELITRCWEFSPENRPTMEEVVHCLENNPIVRVPEEIDEIRKSLFENDEWEQFSEELQKCLFSIFNSDTNSLDLTNIFLEKHEITAIQKALAYNTSITIIRLRDDQTGEDVLKETARLSAVKYIETHYPSSFKWIKLCSYFSQDPLSINWLKVWLEQIEGSEDVQEKSKEIIDCLQLYDLIDFQHDYFHVKPCLFEALNVADKKSISSYEDALNLLLIFKEPIEATEPEMMELAHAWMKYAELLKINSFFNSISISKQAEFWRQLGHVRKILNHYDEALKAYKTSLALCQNPLDTAKTLNQKGKLLYAKGNYEKAYRIFKKANRLEFCDNLERVETLKNLGTALHGDREYRKALKKYQEALSCLDGIEKFPNRTKALLLQRANLNCYIGDAYFQKKTLSKAEKFYRTALEIYDEIHLNKNNLRRANVLNNLGGILRELNQLEEAQKYHQDALEIGTIIYGENPSYIVANTYNLLGYIHFENKEFEKAMHCWHLSLKIFKAIHPENPLHEDIKAVNHNLELLKEKQKRD